MKRRKKKKTFRMPYGWIAWGGICAMVESQFMSPSVGRNGVIVLGFLAVFLSLVGYLVRQMDKVEILPWWWWL